ncbi:LLM class flavin-dependent oxidoreductase [Rhodococcus ruber]|uniref:LLM class flavin-dependent oxidoreductase n=1 Tax=Rhodococcus ruber TaxID=1830 RepID=A0ABT4MDT2_9NOCA|nr:LLM class flavin-dependent oxidoreductase [Rhodococcus ruber]MCZ4519146.1 LLM class flavin-dependent oxidoreductase [Rhodococcus ruber]
MTAIGQYEVGVGLAGNFVPQDYAPLAARLEDAGFDAVTVFGDLMYQPPALVLHTMASSTSRVRLGIAAYTPWTQHPVEIAGQVAHLDAASGGRAFYGLVRGAWMEQLKIDSSRALAAIVDTASIVTALLAGDASGYEGTVYSLTAGTTVMYPVHRPNVPLLIGSWSPRLAAIAGRIADELQAGGSANPAMVSRLAKMSSAGRTGKTPGICLNAIAVVDEDSNAARVAARTAAAPYFDVVAAHDPTVQLDPELLARIRVMCRDGNHRGAGMLIPDDVLDKFAFAGTPTQVAHQAADIIRAGAHRVEFDTPFGLTTATGIRLLCEQVLPTVRDILRE